MLSSVQQLALPLEKHRNHYLFSDYYLNTLLPRQPRWLEADAQAAQALEAIRQLYTDRHALLRPTVGEPALEDQWIRPILDLLGHAYHVQPSLPSPEGTRTPDYALFPDEATRRAALPHLGTAEFFETALAVADAKRWDRSLDRRLTDGAGDAFSNANPSYQIDYYLRITGRNWGLLTNGRLWRLYSRESSFRLDSYYEVDLINLLEQGQVEDFKYFYLFFRRAAFPEFLNWVLRESREHAQAISERLKERIYEALRLLAEGFLKYPGTTLTAADLKEIHDNALILLYRLLFIFYAESRRLLPLENRSYAELYSLKAVKEEIADRLDRKMIYLPRQATIWDNLKALFHIINEGNAELGVPAYNGRLFDPTKYPFLEQHTIGDAYLVQALDGLARAKGPQGLDFVDYRDLEIRHLGSIYEGLLEYQLRHADQDMAVVKDGKVERVVPAEEGQKVAFSAGSVYPVTERGERKATGSYYTPDYIVKYIVENTVGPLVDEKQRAIQDRLNDLEAKLKAARGENRKLLERELVRERDRFGETVLELQVLDPAMGSGHFLVEATDYLAQRIVDFGVRLGAGAEVAKGPDETEISYWRRRAVESCIYGVDVNPLAVELAKLSLWLATAAKGKPLSFLDHHLRCGNSLIGARLEDLGGLPVKKKGKPVPAEQMALFDESAFTRDVSLAVHGLAAIQALASDSVEDIHQKERIFQELLDVHLKRWRQIADLWASAYFGNEMAPKDYAELVRQVQTGESWLSDAQAQPYLDRANALWQDKRFFHWELEFPEVFFDQYGRRKPNPGFDAVVGNPPYVKAKADDQSGVLAEQRRVLVQLPDYAWLIKKWDLYVAFIERGYRLLRNGGRISLIVPDVLDREEYASMLRAEIARLATIEQLDFFPQVELFPGVGIHNLVFLFVKMVPSPGWGPRRYLHADSSLKSIQTLTRLSQDEYGERIFNWQYHPETTPLVSYAGPVEKLDHICYLSVGMVLNADEKVAQGAFTKSDLISDSPTMIHTQRYADNESVFRYELTNIRYLEYGTERVPGQVRRPTFPELHQGSRLLIPRSGGGTFVDGDLICDQRIVIFKPWHELKGVENRSIAAELNRITASSGLVVDDLVKLSSRYDLRYILAIVNCPRVLEELAWRSKRDRYDFTPDAFRELPIRRIAFTTPVWERESLGEAAQALYAEYLDTGKSKQLLEFVESRLETITDEDGQVLEPEQSDVVHDLLAHLAGQMIEMHKAKNEETRGFLNWLAGYTGRPIEDWSSKTNLKAYYQHDWAGMQRVLDSNRRQIKREIKKVDVLGREAQEHIQHEYEASVGKLRPLLARIAATDRLIDLIIYRLYGLTAKEVAVVEGTL